jgi:hypothetical protein
MSAITKPLVVFIPDTRGVVISRFGRGNLKIGEGVYTYSRLPGSPHRRSLGISLSGPTSVEERGTCPGSSVECRSICYAVRPVEEQGAVFQMWRGNAASDVPMIPDDAKILRLHISGDFDTPEYIHNWLHRMLGRPDVTMWVYTRSWRVPELLEGLEKLRALPNVQMFASMDLSIPEVPPAGWRRAWIDGDVRGGTPQEVAAHTEDPVTHNLTTFDGTPSYVCPEETKRVANCEACGYCFNGTKNDVTFLKH